MTNPTGIHGVRGSLLIPILLILFSPFSLEAQVPGQRIPTRDRIRAEFISNIMEGINRAKEGWVADVNGHQLESLMTRYAPDAMMVPPGDDPIYGREAIRSYWQEALPSLGRVQTALADLDASGQMAMLGGTYTLNWLGRNGESPGESGGILMVFVQVGRDWFIRGQVFGSREDP